MTEEPSTTRPMTAPSANTSRWNEQIRTSGSLRLPTLNNDEKSGFSRLEEQMDGELRFDDVHRFLYATDASIYECIPKAVALLRSKEDLHRIVELATELSLPITPRTAGTSLSGQTVGAGIVVDTGRFMGLIWDLDEDERTTDLGDRLVLLHW